MKSVRLALGLAAVGVSGVVALTVVAVHGFGGHGGEGAQTGQAYLAGAQWPGGSAEPSVESTVVTSPSATVPPSAGPSGSARPAATTPAPPKTTKTTRPASTATSAAGVANAVLAHVNELRAANGLPPYTMTSGLVASAHAHNLLMLNGCGLSHQCPGEKGLGDRISAQGVKWNALGENIGYGGGVSNTTAAITASANGMTTGMYNEKPPNDGHRKNLLSSTYTHIGIDVVRDGSGTVWLTQDFSN
jgi:uncharacterized protein YkwD